MYILNSETHSFFLCNGLGEKLGQCCHSNGNACRSGMIHVKIQWYILSPYPLLYTSIYLYTVHPQYSRRSGDRGLSLFPKISYNRGSLYPMEIPARYCSVTEQVKVGSRVVRRQWQRTHSQPQQHGD